MLKRNKIKIHIETGKLLSNNINSDESICSFFIAQEDQTKKLLKTEFETSEDYKDYIEKYLLAIKNVNDDKYDMLTHKNSKYLFYNFNNYPSRIGRPVQFVRYTQIPDNDYALTTLQEKNAPYFIETILEISKG